VRYRPDDPAAIRPVHAWAQGPLEVRVAFDGPLDPAAAAALVGGSISFGAYVRAGDQQETLAPPYQSVKDQQAVPRGSLRIAVARLQDDGRTLVLTTDPHPWQATYALSIPAARPAGSQGPGQAVELDYDLQGAEASFTAEGAAEPSWTLSWPHLDTAAAQAWTRGSMAHDRGFADLASPGRLDLRTLVRQPERESQLLLSADVPFEAGLYGELQASELLAGSTRHGLSLPLEPGGDPVDLAVTLQTGTRAAPGLTLSLQAAEDPVARAVPATSLILPWAPSPAPESAPAAAPAANLDGGDPARGEAVFFSETAKCSVCHQVRGKGGLVGPDLSNLAHRDAASIHRDITDPSAVLHPDFVPYTVALTDGRVAVGVVRAVDEHTIRVLDISAQATEVRRDEIDIMEPSRTSIMPVGLAGAIGEAALRDLIAYLRQDTGAR
jgi:putative heme-binding domain-containing protein